MSLSRRAAPLFSVTVYVDFCQLSFSTYKNRAVNLEKPLGPSKQVKNLLAKYSLTTSRDYW